MLLKKYAYNISCATTRSMVLVCRLREVALVGFSMDILGFVPVTTNNGN